MDDLVKTMANASADISAAPGGRVVDFSETPRRRFLLSRKTKTDPNKATTFCKGTPNTDVHRRTETPSPYTVTDNLPDNIEAGAWQDRKSSVLKMSSRKALQQNMQAEMDVLNAYWGWRGILSPEYELLEGYTLLDVEGYYKRAIDRMLSLAFRSDVHVVGENDKYVTYLNKRLNQIGYVMGKGFIQFLKDVIRNLWICSNCIVSKVRDSNNSGGQKSERNGNLVPVAGYAIIPPHTIFPYMDGHGHIEKWRRFYKDGRPYRDYLPEDIIHFKWDVKPGHIYGTPRCWCVKDDIFALRRLEENVELLLVNHLFPLFHVKVGNEKGPVEYLPDGSSEIDWIRGQIQNMPKEGVFITDDRVAVDVKGADGKGVDPKPMLDHFKNRVFSGLGMSAVDMGEGDSTTKSTSENVSQNLKDQIRADMQTFADMVQMEVFREIFQESPVKISVQDAVATTYIDFGEIDVDGQIKQETHALNSFQSHAIDQDELRRRYRRNPLQLEQRKNMHFERHMVGLEKVRADQKIRIDNNLADHAAKQTAVQASTKKTTVKKANSKTGVGTTRTVEEPGTHTQKLLSNIVQPANQHGKNLDPHKARSSEDPALNPTTTDVAAFYDDLASASSGLEPCDATGWHRTVDEAVGRWGLEPVVSAQLKHALSLSNNLDLAWTTLRSYLEPEQEDENPWSNLNYD